MMKSKLLLSLLVLSCCLTVVFSQNTQPLQKANYFTKASWVKEVPSLASQIAAGTFIPAEDEQGEVNPKHRGANKAVPGKGLPKGPDPLWDQQQNAVKMSGNGPILTFLAASSGSTPTDPTGAVGPNNFVNAWNSAFRIWDKAGNPLTPAASLATIWPGQTLGDPIVMYDAFADRFILTQFYFNGFLFAISQGPDPVTSGWYTYQFPTNSFPDYPKFSVWSDGYYITSNKNSASAGSSQVVFAIERDKIIVGDPTAQMIGFPLTGITTNGFYSPLGFNCNGSELPPPGDAPIVYMQDDSWFGVSTDHLKLWKINVDWDTPSNSTISSPQILNTQPFDGLFDGGSFSNLPQPSGQDIDALQATIMYMAQYRRFSDHNSAVFNFVVDLDGNDDHSGIRWFELRQDNDDDDWQIYQEGTYAQPDGHSASSGNMCMDAYGNIALAYTTVSNSMYPSLKYTGRFSTDPLGVMTLAEETIDNGTQSDPSSRYGDYSQMTIDPTDDATFWSIGEYFTGGTRRDFVGVFKIAPEITDDVGIINVDEPTNGLLTNAEQVTVTIRNFGMDTQSNIPVSFQIDGGTVVSEVFTGSVASSTNVQYTFTTTGDFSNMGETYEIKAFTNLSTDQDESNDTITAFVTHLFPDDIGVTAISSPVSGSYLSANEPVTVTVENFGADTQSGFDISFILDGGTPVTETVPGPLTMESTMEYTFNATADLSDIGYHDMTVTTSLPGDADNTNDSTTATIVNSLCQPELMCTQGVGIYDFQLGTISNNTGCDPNGYGNYTNLSTDLEQGSANDLTISTQYGNVYVKVWIDFNDNFVFEANEVVVNDYVIAPGQTNGNYSETMPLTIAANANLGEHLLRTKTNYNASVPTDPCEETTFGETEDYMVNITMGTGLDENTLEPNDLILANTGSNHFDLSFKALHLTGDLIVSIHNIQGQTVLQNQVQNIDGTYRYDFDMSYAPKGVYLLRLGNESFGKVKRFVVK